eukprot:g3837.t1
MNTLQESLSRLHFRVDSISLTENGNEGSVEGTNKEDRDALTSLLITLDKLNDVLTSTDAATSSEDVTSQEETQAENKRPTQNMLSQKNQSNLFEWPLTAIANFEYGERESIPGLATDLTYDLTTVVVTGLPVPAKTQWRTTPSSSTVSINNSKTNSTITTGSSKMETTNTEATQENDTQ